MERKDRAWWDGSVGKGNRALRHDFWVQFLGPTWWKKRTIFHKLSSDLRAVTQEHTHNTHTHSGSSCWPGPQSSIGARTLGVKAPSFSKQFKNSVNIDRIEGDNSLSGWLSFQDQSRNWKEEGNRRPCLLESANCRNQEGAKPSELRALGNIERFWGKAKQRELEEVGMRERSLSRRIALQKMAGSSNLKSLLVMQSLWYNQSEWDGSRAKFNGQNNITRMVKLPTIQITQTHSDTDSLCWAPLLAQL